MGSHKNSWITTYLKTQRQVKTNSLHVRKFIRFTCFLSPRNLLIKYGKLCRRRKYRWKRIRRLTILKKEGTLIFKIYYSGAWKIDTQMKRASYFTWLNVQVESQWKTYKIKLRKYLRIFNMVIGMSFCKMSYLKMSWNFRK